jgi:hypothetical protein
VVVVDEPEAGGVLEAGALMLPLESAGAGVEAGAVEAGAALESAGAVVVVDVVEDESVAAGVVVVVEVSVFFVQATAASSVRAANGASFSAERNISFSPSKGTIVASRPGL